IFTSKGGNQNAQILAHSNVNTFDRNATKRLLWPDWPQRCRELIGKIWEGWKLSLERQPKRAWGFMSLCEESSLCAHIQGYPFTARLGIRVYKYIVNALH
ncbi:hypothetical protein QTP86_024435, partial [Hemibagrus guttatus]